MPRIRRPGFFVAASRLCSQIPGSTLQRKTFERFHFGIARRVRFDRGGQDRVIEFVSGVVQLALISRRPLPIRMECWSMTDVAGNIWFSTKRQRPLPTDVVEKVAVAAGVKS